ncbi:hypothetical protein EI427_17980 [Flammeovirga pectinis]|uniref:DUF4374 domain-containing protein n=1 Tax=Flammeovirga pectinis TaxID=2494373 RepID=A0A3Q9FN91_9BACT|nr:hypothetical protein [Flammeovirga pectinis]AZQ64047.1 hypothetical protein EI427_17980 [Flammeovirga pectinis]
MKILNLFALLCFLTIFSCSKDDDEPSTDVGGPTTDIDLEDRYSSVEVDLSDQPKTLENLLGSDLYSKPTSPYGVKAIVDFMLTDNPEEIDVFWRSSSDDKHLTRVNITTGGIVSTINLPSEVQSGRHLGIASIGSNKYLMGYSKDNAHGNENYEAWYTAFDNNGTVDFSKRVFGDTDKTVTWSKGDAGGAGNGIIAYNATQNVASIFLAHEMLWDKGPDDRHQAGWKGFIDIATKDTISNNGKMVGNSWYYSHNFDQRTIAHTDNNFYSLSHGDTYDRALAITKWSSSAGKELESHYHKIQFGKDGNNETKASTGDICELPDGNLAVVFSTVDERNSKDLQLQIIKKSDLKTTQQQWITGYNAADGLVGWGSKVVAYGDDKILVGYNTFKGTEGAGWNDYNLNLSDSYSTIALTDYNGNLLATHDFDDMFMFPTQSFKATTDNSKIIAVSAEEGSKLKIHLISVE